MQKKTAALFFLIITFFSVLALDDTTVRSAGHEYIPDINSAKITSSKIDLGNLSYCFDGNLKTLVRSANENPAWVQIEFPEVIEVYKVKVSLGSPGYYDIVHNWWLESADSEGDLASKTGSYRIAIPERSTKVDNVWDEVIPQETVKGKIWRFHIRKTLGDNYVHIPELSLSCYYNGIKLDVSSFLKTGLIDVKGSKTVTDNIARCFDENTLTNCSDDSPANLLIDFKEPKLRINRLRVFVGTNQDSETDRLRIEAANSLEDLRSGKGSYKLVFGREDTVKYQAWKDVYINIPVNRRYWNFNVERTDTPSKVHISDIEFWVDQISYDYPPKLPEDFRLIERKETEAILKWSPSIDSTGFVQYDIFRDGVKVGSTKDVTFIDKNLNAERGYSYCVQAYNISRKYSERSTQVIANPFLVQAERPGVTEPYTEGLTGVTAIPKPTGTITSTQTALPKATPTNGVDSKAANLDTSPQNDKSGLGVKDAQNQVKQGKKFLGSRNIFYLFIIVLVIFLVFLIYMIMKLKKRMLLSQRKRETELNAIKQLLMEEKTEHVLELLRRKSKNKKE